MREGRVKRFELHRCQVTSGGSGCSGMQLLYLHIVRIEIPLYEIYIWNGEQYYGSGRSGEALEDLKLCVCTIGISRRLGELQLVPR